MSIRSSPSDRATDLFIGGLDQVIDPVVVRYRSVARNGGDVADLICDAGLFDVSVFDGCAVKVILNRQSKQSIKPAVSTWLLRGDRAGAVSALWREGGRSRSLTFPFTFVYPRLNFSIW